MNMKKSKIFGICMVLVFTMMLSACGKSTEGLVATVDKMDITREEFDADLNFFKSMYEKQLGEGFMSQVADNGKTYEEQLKIDIMEKLKTEKLIEKDSKGMGIKVTDEDIDGEFNKYVEAMGGKEKFDEYLSGTGITEEFFKANLGKEMLIRKHAEKFKEDTEISDEDAKEYFEKNKDNLIIVKARHILVQSEEEGEKVLARVNGGEDFAKVAMETSIDTSAVDGGDLGYFPKGKMIAEFENVAFSLEPGQISDLVKTEVGYHIIKVEDRKDSFEDLGEDIKSLLKDEKYFAKIESLKTNAKVKIYDQDLKKLMEDGEKVEK